MRIAAALSCVALVACGGSSGWRDPADFTSSEGNQTVCAAGQTVEGIDVSAGDGTVDWVKVKASGRVFAFAKVTEGMTYVDPSFATNWAAMKRAGLIRGAYHYFRPQDEGAVQATWMLHNLGTLEVDDLPPVLDVETTDSQATATVNSRIAACVRALEAATGRTPIIYSSNRFWTTVLGNTTAPCDLWDAHWGVTCPSIPSPWREWRFWQYNVSDAGFVPGVGSQSDLDRFNGTLAELQAYVATNAGAGDGGAGDGGARDGGGLDGGAGDAGLRDGGDDAGSAQPDAGDAGAADAGHLDAGASDAGIKQAGDGGVVLAQSAGGCSSRTNGGPLLLLLLCAFTRSRGRQLSASSSSGASSARIIS